MSEFEGYKEESIKILKKFNADEIQTETKIYDLFP